MLNSNSTPSATENVQAHMAFLSLASEDDGFRADIQRDPAAALARFGLEIEPERLPSTVRLPGKPAIRQALGSADDIEFLDPAWKGFIAC